MQFQNLSLGLLLISFLFLAVAGPGAARAEICTILFESSSCPDTAPVCGASFSGGNGCVFAGLGNCYESGVRSYQVDSGSLVTATLDPAISAITVFFAHTGSGTEGTMRFFDSATGGSEVGTAMTTNGNCEGATMPSNQTQNFTTPVRRIEVSVTGSGNAWIDTMVLTQSMTPVEKSSWGLLKTFYR